MTSDIKITDLLNSEKPTFSLEVTPDIEKLKLDKLSFEPAFFCVTWHAKSYDFKNFDIPPLKLAKYLRSKRKTVCLHISCDLMKRDYLNELLDFLRDIGVCNLFVVLGENYDYINSDFKLAKELISHIKKQSGDYFCIGVAGFPACSDTAMLLMKQKIDAGADFIVTQAFFEPISYNKFLIKCVNAGIRVPIIPGMFVYETKQALQGFSSLCKIKVPSEVLDADKSGVETVMEMIKNMRRTSWKHFHFFTLNKIEPVSSFVQKINKIFEEETLFQQWDTLK